MKKIILILPVCFMLSSCKALALIATRAIALKYPDETKSLFTILLVVLFYELLATFLPFLISLNILTEENSNVKKIAIKYCAVLSGISLVIGLIELVSEKFSVLLSLGLLIGVLYWQKTYFKISWGRSWGIVGLAVIFSFIGEGIFELIFS